MKRTNKTVIAVLAGTLLLGGAGAVLASGGYHGKGGCDFKGAPMHALERVDNLTDEQRNQISEIMDTQRSAMRERRDEMRDSRTAVRDAIHNGADEATLKPLAQKQGEMVAQMIMERAKVQGQISAVLTEEQRQQLQQLREERREQRRGDDDERRGHYRW